MVVFIAAACMPGTTILLPRKQTDTLNFKIKRRENETEIPHKFSKNNTVIG